jgi:hypothetical protein
MCRDAGGAASPLAIDEMAITHASDDLCVCGSAFGRDRRCLLIQFVTGTDTGVGKTVTSAWLAARAVDSPKKGDSSLTPPAAIDIVFARCMR